MFCNFPPPSRNGDMHLTQFGVPFEDWVIEVISMAAKAFFLPLPKLILLLPLLSVVLGHKTVELGQYPLVVSTWPFVEAVRAAWRAVDGGSSAVDSVVEGCSACEALRCDGTDSIFKLSLRIVSGKQPLREAGARLRTLTLVESVGQPLFGPLGFFIHDECTYTCLLPVLFQKVGPGGSPDENGETTIDALVMDGVTMEVGAVAAMRYVKDGIKAARLVMHHTEHTLLVGEKASAFAISMGLPGPTNLSSSESIEKWTKWKANNCQPNFWKNVLPENSCGPYRPANYLEHTDETCSNTCRLQTINSRLLHLGLRIHDTISMAVIDRMGHIAVGTSTNGATFKIPGRVGDGPIAGSSAYADDEVGACCATGDGDIMMRFLPCYQVVESMRLGMEPKLAAQDAIVRIARKFPDFMGAVVALNKKGEHAGACHGWTFKYSVRSPVMDDVEVFTVLP